MNATLQTIKEKTSTRAIINGTGTFLKNLMYIGAFIAALWAGLQYMGIAPLTLVQAESMITEAVKRERLEVGNNIKEIERKIDENGQVANQATRQLGVLNERSIQQGKNIDNVLQELRLLRRQLN